MFFVMRGAESSSTHVRPRLDPRAWPQAAGRAQPHGPEREGVNAHGAVYAGGRPEAGRKQRGGSHSSPGLAPRGRRSPGTRCARGCAGLSTRRPRPLRDALLCSFLRSRPLSLSLAVGPTPLPTKLERVSPASCLPGRARRRGPAATGAAAAPLARAGGGAPPRAPPGHTGTCPGHQRGRDGAESDGDSGPSPSRSSAGRRLGR